MFPNLSPGAIGVRANLEQSAHLAKKFGFKGIDIDLDEAKRQGVETVRKLLSSHGISAGGTGLPVEYRKDEGTFRDDLAELPRRAELAEALGCTRFTTWVLPGSNDLPFAEHFDLLKARFRACADILKDHGQRLGLEFIGPKTLRSQFKHEFIYTLPGMLELCDAVGTGNVGLLLDCWHWYTSGGTLDDVAALSPEHVVYVHVNDAPAGVPVNEQVDNIRRLPMETGVINLAGFLSALERLGYDGPVTAEPFREDLGALPPEQAVRTTAEAMKKAWNAAGISW